MSLVSVTTLALYASLSETKCQSSKVSLHFAFVSSPPTTFRILLYQLASFILVTSSAPSFCLQICYALLSS